MSKFFITSDVHSFFDELMVALNESGFDINNKDHVLCVCGDLFDRGPQAAQLFSFVKELQSQDRLIYVAGNHETLLFNCVEEIYMGRVPSSHHWHNKTVDTVCQMCGDSEWIMYDPSCRDRICRTMQPVLDFISDNCVDYAEIGDHILVHGWIPCYRSLNDFRDATSEDWDRARWENGMEMWKNPMCRVEGKTVVCGHWHCSWGWSHIKQERQEFPQKSKKDWLKSFEPFVDEGIAAIDSCVAYTGKINVLVLEDNVWK